MQRHVDGIGGTNLCIALYRRKLLHWSAAAVGPEFGLMAHPVGTLAGDGALGELVFELHLELCAVEAALAGRFGNVKFASLFLSGIRYLVGHERGGREDELEGFDRFQLSLQGLVCVDREAGCSYFEARPWLNNRKRLGVAY